MKRIKPYVLIALVAMTVLCLSACGRNDNAGGGNSSGTTTSGAESSSSAESSSMESSSMNDTRAADEAGEESTGVIDGMINDVEKGVDDITGESGGQETSAGESSSAAQ